MIIANYVSSPGIVELDYANVEIADDLEEARATSNALTALTTRVTNAEGVNATQTTSITNLTNNLSTTNNAVSTKADSSALNTLSSKVTGIDGVVSTHTSAITALEGRATTIEGNVAKKLESSAITNYYTKTEADTATAGHINNYNANLVIGGTNLLKNSDFSSGLTHWEGGSATLTIIDDSLSKFKKVVKVVSTATTGGIKVVNASSIGMMTANETYTISGWIRSASNLTVYISLDGSGLSLIHI